MTANSDNGGDTAEDATIGKHRLRELVQLCNHQQQQIEQLKQLLQLQARDRKLFILEMHDGFVQECTGALMLLEALAADVESQSRPWVENLTRSVDLLRSSLDEARRLMRGIRPPGLEEQGLLPTLQDLLTEFQKRLGLTVEFRHSPCIPRLAASAELAIYRIVQEALYNVWKHAGCSTASVALDINNNEIVVTIADRGVGFDTGVVRPDRRGLSGIAERAQLLDGAARVTSCPEEGTQITVSLPRLPREMDAKSGL